MRRPLLTGIAGESDNLAKSRDRRLRVPWQVDCSWSLGEPWGGRDDGEGRVDAEAPGGAGEERRMVEAIQDQWVLVVAVVVLVALVAWLMIRKR